MPDVGEFKESRYLTQHDVDPPKVLTIDKLQREMVGQGADAKAKAVIRFREQVKPWVCGPQTLELMATFPGFGRNTDSWGGRKIELYRDPSVAFGGKVTGGIRARIPGVGQQALVGGPAPVQYPTLGAAVAACEAQGIPKSELYAHFKAQGVKQYVAAQHSVVVQAFLATKQTPAPAEEIPTGDTEDDAPPPDADEPPPTGDAIPF